jgi:hypothetical protein
MRRPRSRTSSGTPWSEVRVAGGTCASPDCPCASARRLACAAVHPQSTPPKEASPLVCERGMEQFRCAWQDAAKEARPVVD